MKVKHNAQIRLQKGDYRVGNFVFTREPSYIRVVSITGIVSWRVSLDLSVGMLVLQAMREHHDNWLRTYASSVFSHLSVVPDNPFFVKHAVLVNEQVSAHPEFYGKAQPTDDKEEDDRILQEERELHETIDK